MSTRIIITGNKDAGKMLLPTGRKFLSWLKKDMEFNDLKQNQRTINMADGVVFKVQRVFGQDTIDITVPVVEVSEEKPEEEIKATSKYKIKLFNFPVDEDEILTTACLMRMTFYHRSAKSLDDESKIVFDYRVPTETDINGKLETSPEEYFGSDDNPGLEWDDENECFVVDTMKFIAPYLGNTLGYAVALSANELKHFVTYSCKHCPEEESDKYYAARQDQQYPEIIDDDERWFEEDLVEPSFNVNEILEDNISCLIGIYIIAQLGLYRVIWDVSLGGYAKTVINDSDELLTDGDWPVLVSTLTAWYSSTLLKGGTGAQWGTACSINSLSACPAWYYPANCAILDYFCQQPDHYDEDYNNTVRRYIYDCNIGLVTDIDNNYYLTLYSSAAVWSFRSVYGDVNSYQVTIFAKLDRVSEFNSHAVTLGDSYNSNFAQDYWTVVTPWGEAFEGVFIVYNNYSQTQSYPNNPVCSGFTWNENGDYDSEERIFIGYYKSTNIIFFCLGGHYRRDKKNRILSGSQCASSGVVDTHWGKDSIGTMGFYSAYKCSTIDPNNMTGNPDIKEGFNNLMQAYFDDVNVGEPRSITPYIQHREGVV